MTALSYLKWVALGAALVAVGWAFSSSDREPYTDSDGHRSSKGNVARRGVASNPGFQWSTPAVTTVEGGGIDDKPVRRFDANIIARLVFGDDSRAYELVDYNDRTVKGRWIDWTGTIAQGLDSDDALLLPKTWNAWIDEQGFYRGESKPWPPA